MTDQSSFQAASVPSDPRYLVGIDLGAGSLKVTVIDASANIVAEASAAVPTHTPFPTWSEQDPDDWWQACVKSVKAVTARIDANRIAGISFSAGAHIQVLVDEDGNTIRNAMLWSDQRSARETAELRAKADQRIFELAGNRVNPTWTMPQMLWVFQNEPENFARIRRIYSAKDWLRHQFTGGFETDVVDAEGTMFYDVQRGEWSQELCDLVGWPIESLPPVVRARDVVGSVRKDIADDLGLRAGTPVVAGTSDTCTETYGAGMVEPGMAVVKLATAATVSFLSEQAGRDFTLINYSHIVPDHWYTIVGTNSCASAHRWLRETFFKDMPTENGGVFEAMDVLASQTPAGADGLFFHPYLIGERSPYWDPLLRADFIGATFLHGPGHFVRALYEGIAYSLRDCFDVFRQRGLDATKVKLIGGGTRSDLWCQIVADVLDVEVELPKISDASFGTALLAGVGTGVFSDEKSAAAHSEVARQFTPDPERSRHYSEGFAIYREAQAALAPVNHRIHDWMQTAPRN